MSFFRKKATLAEFPGYTATFTPQEVEALGSLLVADFPEQWGPALLEALEVSYREPEFLEGEIFSLGRAGHLQATPDRNLAPVEPLHLFLQGLVESQEVLNISVAAQGVQDHLRIFTTPQAHLLYEETPTGEVAFAVHGRERAASDWLLASFLLLSQSVAEPIFDGGLLVQRLAGPPQRRTAAGLQGSLVDGEWSLERLLHPLDRSPRTLALRDLPEIMSFVDEELAIATS